MIKDYRNILKLGLMTLTLALSVFDGSPVMGQSDAPFIQFTEANRTLDVLAGWSPMPPGTGDGDNGKIEYVGDDLWAENISLNFGLAEAWATQNSDIGRFSVNGKAETYAKVSESVFSGDAGALSATTVGFTIQADSEFLLTANFEFEGEMTTGWSRGQVLMSGMNEQGIYQHEIDSENPDTWNASFAGTITAGKPVFVAFIVHAQRGKHPDQGDFESGESLARLEFSLDFGDRDHDGLLNIWEEEDKIDLGDGAIIDLSQWDPDPDVKDLFVEVDVLHNNSGLDLKQDVFSEVIKSFSLAPADAVDNYDNSPGVNLHVLVDEVIPSHSLAIMTLASVNPPPTPDGLPSGPWVFPPEFQTFKDDHLGTSEIHDSVHWEQGLKEMWLKVFRYALWIDEVRIPADCLGSDDYRRYGGLARSIPGNDFVVAAGHIKDRYDSEPLKIPDDIKFALAGTFMHELGHTLGLRHGGGSFDLPNMKPNYLSVMNYTYSTPLVKLTEQNTNGRIAFLLDYSRQPLMLINESALQESAGLDGPEPQDCHQPMRPEGDSCRILFNSGSEDSLSPKISIGNAMSETIDWNNKDGISPGNIDPVDLTRLVYKSKCTGNTIPPDYQILTSHSDWDRLKFSPPDITDNGNEAGSSGYYPTAEMDQFLFKAILEAEWVDQNPYLDPVIYKDSFEQ